MWIDDRIFELSSRSLAVRVFTPEAHYVVLGRANRFEDECHVENCIRDRVPVYKRSGGGGTVLLHPGCIVVSIGAWVKNYYMNNKYFCLINEALVHVLAEQWQALRLLKHSGLSDLSIDGRKVCGSSMFRSRNYLLFQASILVDRKIDLMERYLCHPSREPAYRQGKSHRDFVVGLNQHVPSITHSEVFRVLSDGTLEGYMKKHFAGELVDPPRDQMKRILSRPTPNPARGQASLVGSMS